MIYLFIIIISETNGTFKKRVEIHHDTPETSTTMT